MKRQLSIYAALACAIGAFADTPATFPGGPEELDKYLATNVKYPVFAMENGIEGTVTVNFIVGRDGSISEVKVARPLDPDLEAEALRIVKGMPKWTPATDDSGAPVETPVSLPVKFRLKH